MKKRMIRFLWMSVLILSISGFGLTGTLYAKTVTLLYTGETHAALNPCNCPIAPNGGLSRRAAVIDKIRKEVPNGELLLLDTGGLFAGGVYDENIAGPKPDRRRTEFTLKALRKMGYNAVGIADEELVYGKEFLLQQGKDLLFLSANVKDSKTDLSPFAPFRIFNIQGVRIGVVGLSPQPAKQISSGIKVGDPITAAGKVIESIRQKADVVVVLSPLGEKYSKKLLQEIPGIDIILNGETYENNQFYQQVEGKHFFQFSFQGRSIGRINMDFDDNNRLININAEPIPLSKDLSDDPEMRALVNAFFAQEKNALDSRIKLDLYVMSYDADSRKILEALSPLFRPDKTTGFYNEELASQIDWNLNFVAGIDKGGSIRSANGPGEVIEDMRQLLIAKYSRDAFWDYLSCINSSIPGTPWQECLGKNAKLIEKKMVRGEGERLLRANINQVKPHSNFPAVFVNNSHYRGNIHPLAFLKDFCGSIDPEVKKTPICRNLPECIENNDCSRDGMVGICSDSGKREAKCSFEKAMKVGMTILYDHQAPGMVNAIDQTETYLKKITPGMQVKRIDFQSDQGKKFSDRYGVDRIPAYLYDKNLPQAKRFAEIRKWVARKGDRYLLNPNEFRATRYFRRKLIPHRIDLFTFPLDPNGNNVVRQLSVFLKKEGSVSSQVKVFFHHMILDNSIERKSRPLGLAPEEEARRRIAIELFHPHALTPYISAWFKRIGTAYWEQPLLNVGLDPRQIKSQSQKKEVLMRLEEDRRLLEGIEKNQPVIILINNQEVVEIRSLDEFKSLYRSL